MHRHSRRPGRPLFFLLAAGIAASLLLHAAPGASQDSAAKSLPANPLLEAHSAFFAENVYHLETLDYSAPHVPENLSYQIFSGVGYNLANSMLLVGPDREIVVVDTLGDSATVDELLDQFRLEAGYEPGAKLPIDAIVYTHNHIDHTGGVDGYLAQAEQPVCTPAALGPPAEANGRFTTREDCVDVISQYKVVDAVENTGTIIGYILNTRSAYMYGNICDPFLGCIVNDGIGPEVVEGDSSFRLPSATVDETLELTAAGIHFFVVYVPSETNDEIMLFVPDALNNTTDQAANPDVASWSAGPGLLLSAEVIQGPAFPNLYSLRGTSFRDPANWFASVDVLRQFDSWCMVPSHGPPLCGQDNIQTLLRNFRDAIQFTHDQTLRYMYRGDTPDQLVERVILPDYLVDDLTSIETLDSGTMDPRDYLRKFYGSVPQAVREIYSGLLGWYQADPVGLSPTPPAIFAERLVAAMGGAAKVAEQATAAEAECETENPATHGECQWAAELATYVARLDPDSCLQNDVETPSRDACRVKAKAFRKLGTAEIDPNWRNWYLTSAIELEGVLAERDVPAPTGGLVSPEIVANLPPESWVRSFSYLLEAERTTREAPAVASFGFHFPDSLPEPDERYVLHIRKAIAELIDVDGAPYAPQAGYRAWEEAQVQASIPQSALLALLQKESNQVANGDPKPFADLFVEAVESGEIVLLRGTNDEARSFFENFDQRPANIQRLTVR